MLSRLPEDVSLRVIALCDLKTALSVEAVCHLLLLFLHARQ